MTRKAKPPAGVPPRTPASGKARTRSKPRLNYTKIPSLAQDRDRLRFLHPETWQRLQASRQEPEPDTPAGDQKPPARDGRRLPPALPDNETWDDYWIAEHSGEAG